MGGLLLSFLGVAQADPEVTIGAASTATDGSSSLVYVEALGKAGAYGVGYEHALAPRIALGFEGSYVPLRSQTLATGVPYMHVTPLRRGGNALFGELGVELAYSKLESSVARWMGTSTTGIGGVASVGYERTLGKKLVLRGAVSLLAGKGGMAPWAGLTIGVNP